MVREGGAAESLGIHAAEARAYLIQWRAFLGEHGFMGPKIELCDAVARARAFVMPAHWRS